MTKTVLITGAGGNIGAKVRAHFAGLGWTLRLLDLDARGDAAVTACDLAVWNESWVRAFAGVDCVIHLAGDPRSFADWGSVQLLNMDLFQNVYEAAARAAVKRLVFASSNWVMAGHRFGAGVVTTAMEAAPVNPYGASKLMGERMGRSYWERWGLSVICFRIGYCQTGENVPGPQMGWGSWGQAMWLSNRDLCQAMERAVLAEGVGFSVLNLMSDNPGMRWDIETTKRVIGYAPRDGWTAVLPPEKVAAEANAALTRGLADRLGMLDAAQKW